MKNSVHITDVCSRDGIFTITVRRGDMFGSIFKFNRFYKIKLNNPFEEEINSFIESIIKDRTVPITSLEGKENIKILSAVYKSALKNKTIRVR